MTLAAQNIAVERTPVRHPGTIFLAKVPDFASATIGQAPGALFGDFGSVGRMLRTVRRELCTLTGLGAGERALDVTAGSPGSASSVQALSEASYDVVTSAFASAFAPDLARAASDLLRVCRKGGRVAVATWKPDGFVGQVAGTIRRYLPVDGRVDSPVMWGTRKNLDAVFGRAADALGAVDRSYALRYRSGEAWLGEWCSGTGPLADAFRAVEPEWRDQLARELLGLVDRFNESSGKNVVIHADYLVCLVHKSTWRPVLQ